MQKTKIFITTEAAARLEEGPRTPDSQLTPADHRRESECYLTSEQMAKDAAEELHYVREMDAPLYRRRSRMKHLKEVYQEGTGRVWEAQQPMVRLVSNVGDACSKALDTVQIPSSFINLIIGRIGFSGGTVFIFMKDLIRLNLVGSLVLLFSLLGPALYQTNVLDQPLASTEGWTILNNSATDNRCPHVNATLDNPKVRNCSSIYLESENSTRRWNEGWWVSELLLGNGRFEHSLLFLGYYPATLLEGGYHTAVAQVVSVLVVFLSSLVTVVSRVGKWLRYNSSIWGGLVFSRMVFIGYDFSLRSKSSIRSKQRMLAIGIRAALDEHAFQRSKSQRTNAQLVWLFVVRVVVNCVSLAALSLGCTVIVMVTNNGRSIVNAIIEDEDSWMEGSLVFLVSFLDTLSVWLLGLVLPPMLSLLGSLEKFSSRVTMLLFILRNSVVRLVSLAVLVASNLTLVGAGDPDECRPDFPCWETTLAQTLYSQVVWDFAMRLVTTAFLLVYRLVSLLLSRDCKFEFDVPSRVLDIISLQTVLWVSVLVSPMVPVLSLISLYFGLWLEFLVALLAAKPSKHVFQVSHSSAMFMVVLAVCWVGAAAVAVAVLCVIRPSLGCGPFRGLAVAWDALTHYICSLQGSSAWLRSTYFLLDNLTVTLSVALTLLLAIFYHFWLVQHRLTLIRRLEKRIKEVSQEKVFLMERQQRLRLRPAPEVITCHL